MKNGKLLTCGSALFLKNKFGVGYDLNVIKNDAETPYEPIFECIQAVIACAKIIGNSGMELKIRLPIDTLPLFENLFQSIETNMAGLRINNYGISLNSLEQVFINVTNSDAKPADMMPKMVSPTEFGKFIDRSSSPNIGRKKVQDEPIQSNWSIIDFVTPSTQRDSSRFPMINCQKPVREEPIEPICPIVGLGSQGYPSDNSFTTKNSPLKKKKSERNIFGRSLGSGTKSKRGIAILPIPIVQEKTKLRVEPIEPIFGVGDEHYVRETSMMAIFRMHFWALTKKKLHYFKRDKKAITCELIVPMLCIFSGLLLTLISFVNESPSMDLNASIGGKEVTPYNVYYDALSNSEASSLFTDLATNPNIT
jgi:hypothetical protein